MSSLATLTLALSPILFAQDAAQDATPDRAALEAEFAAKMSGVVLVGHFTDTSAPAGTAPAEERYTLGDVTKREDGRWRFEAQVDYGGKSFPVALNLDVEWAGDTPVITMTDYKIMLVGTFTCRVMFYGDLYAGTWEGKSGSRSHGGHMFGRLERPAPTEPAAGAVDDDDNDNDDDDKTVHWPSFRGPDGAGVAYGFPTAESFDVETLEGIGWRTEVPGLCHSSPIVWADRVYVTTAIRADGEDVLKVGLYGSTAAVEDDSRHEYRLLALDKYTGRILWNVLAWEGVPAVKRHPKGSHAASTPAANGEVVICHFGSEGLYAFDTNGKRLWKQDLGKLVGGWFQNGDQWGYSSSPVMFEDKVIVQCDVLGDSFVAAYRVSDGEELWRTVRDEVPGWGTPTVDVRDGRRQVILNGYKHMGGYDVDTGAELWKIAGGGDIPVPRPIVAHDLVYITNFHGMMAPVYAIDAMAVGEIDRKHESMVWHQTRGGNYMQTPLVYGDELFLCSDAGILTCTDARTGKEHYRERVGDGASGYTASIVAADEKLYLTSEEGQVRILGVGTTFEPVGEGNLGEESMATPAISEGVIYWRTKGHVVAVAR